MMLGMFAATSCTDANDWDVDSSHERLFAPTGSINVESFDTYANISFKKTPGAAYYQVELNTDTLSDDNMEVSPTSIVETFYTNEGSVGRLYGETSYYLRVRAISDTKPESRWVYYRTGSGKGTFKTKAEQLFYPVTKADIFENAIHVTWQLNADVDRLAIMKDGEVIENVTLTDELRQAGEYTFTVEYTRGEGIVYESEPFVIVVE